MSICLVTGGAGFIGSHTVDHLLSRGYHVRVLDALQERVHPMGKPAWLSSETEFVHGDVADPAVVAFALEGVEHVLHLAAYQDYMPDFSTFMHVNAESTALLFEIAVSDPVRYPLKKMVLASSQAVCGEGRYLCPQCAGGVSPPTLEEQLADPRRAYDLPPEGIRVPPSRPTQQLLDADWEIRCPVCGGVMSPLLIDEGTVNPGTVYGISKFAVELLADRLGRRYGIPTACMRYTYVQGSRNSFYNAYSGIARRFALQLLHDVPPVIYEDGRQLRDYVNVADVVRANVLALEDERAGFRVFNVGGGRAVTVADVARLMIEAFDSHLEPVIPGEFRLGDTRHTVSDISALGALGWRPTVPVEHSLQEYAEWMREQRGTRQFLEEAERVMRERDVVRRVGSRHLEVR